MAEDLNRYLSFGAILPHTKLFGGVRRFFELGEILIQRGHAFTIFTPEGIPPDWFTFHGEVKPLNAISSYRLDALFLTETDFVDHLVNANAALKIFYHVGPRAKLTTVLKHKQVLVFSNSSNMYTLDKRKYGIETIRAFGGVHLPAKPKPYSPAETIHIMAYGRLTRKGKGTALVVRACEKLYKKGYPVKLLLFDSPIDDRSSEKIRNFTCKVPFEFILDHPVMDNEELFKRADIFVAAEKKGGWSNTAAEALASGIPLVATKTGTNDFLVHGETGLKVWRHPYFIRRAIETLIKDPALAQRLSGNGRKKIAEFSWTRLADFIEAFVKDKINSRQPA